MLHRTFFRWTWNLRLGLGSWRRERQAHPDTGLSDTGHIIGLCGLLGQWQWFYEVIPVVLDAQTQTPAVRIPVSFHALLEEYDESATETLTQQPSRAACQHLEPRSMPNPKHLITHIFSL